MNKLLKIFLALFVMLCLLENINAQKKAVDVIEQNFLHPPTSAKPWVFWYWMHGAVSKAGITADLEAMKQVGIGGAYLMPIKDTVATIPFQPTVRQLSPEWWAMVKFAMQEAKRLNLKLAMHVSDGFALAGGPWITPELSMQKIVFTKTIVAAGEKIKLPKPEAYQGFYKDVAVFAYPANFKMESKLLDVVSNNNTSAKFLTDPKSNETFRSDSACWIQFTYDKPFTLRQVKIKKQNNAYQSQRFVVQASNDGIAFKSIDTLIPPRHGWQDWDQDYTHAVTTHTAKYFRLLWSKEGTEPGSEDLETAKWGSGLRVKGIYLSSEPGINNYEAKNGSIWRVANATTTNEVSNADAVALKDIIDVSSKMDTAGNINWVAPAGEYVIVRMGHTSTGATNATGGAGKGLECDKFNAAAVTLQFDNWFAKAFSNINAALAKEVLKVFHVDSWECGSQNWSSNFENEFLKRRGYDLRPYLLTMAGIPINDAATSEKILHDVRTTIADLINDVFYTTLKNLAHKKGCSFSAEAIAPTMVSDGLQHYKNVDLPMGEFWLNSPTHDKPNDMLDAISGAHIYGKNIVQAEAFTSVRMNWGEHPGNLKALGDRNFALGINKMVFHVFTHNPWMDKKPGMTLDGVGLYFQRDQTWFKQSKAWVDYITRCQALLQLGKPVVDIAVFTGEEIPRRAVLPDRLVNTLPGIFGKDKVAVETIRLQNTGQPTRKIPDGVTHSANMADPEDWVNALNGYQYDSFNPDALMMMQVKDGTVVLPGGAAYKIIVIPAGMKLNPANAISNATVNKIIQLVKDGATVLIDSIYQNIFAANGYRFNFVAEQQLMISLLGKGKFIATPYWQNDFTSLQLQQDVIITEATPGSIAFAHRKVGDADIYFVSNQKDTEQFVNINFRVENKTPEIWDPVTGLLSKPGYWDKENGKINVAEELQPNQSLFFVFRKKYTEPVKRSRTATKRGRILFLKEWEIEFDKNYMHTKNTVTVDSLKSWTIFGDNDIVYYSGTAIYRNKFNATNIEKGRTVILKFDTICNIATIKINGIDCGTLWTAPYQLDISKAIKPGENKIEIAVTNTWHNCLIGDNLLPSDKRMTFTTAPFRLKDKPLLPAGLIGEVKIVMW
ncbi:glycosyl hydrolase [Ferruginibacter sp.]|nr:DNA-binding protein [Ferruginibacter sp.]